MLKGIIANSGYAIGKILKIDQQSIDTSKVTIKSIENEIVYLHEAIDKTIDQLENLKRINAKNLTQRPLQSLMHILQLLKIQRLSLKLKIK
jgi:phosphoenolpyruvate-protein phosphotransferase (PTS system enzyme I)